MNKRRLLIVAAFIALSACGKLGNPLLSASDGQFLRWIAPRNGLAPSCAAALYKPEMFIGQYNGLKFSAKDKISAVSEKQKSECIADLQQRASEIGIEGNITRDHLLDDRVKQRFLALQRG
ncbi:hypothetical protein PG1C_09415 [Rugosibacter aromaticivorans]|jgi:hypothetical protein|uniref:Lipoprotein n=1 Tax=Rugosibacter aromaticivorans TaxID=1565605 RepID=A0A0C5JA39_9PROT|nr:hypothetical protein [Rugosibacter aromaticivorans]AJP48603.1 hypothetical protein PG1C_09415 [Rugosibacter aromaticivorans]TBR13674.1 MAG: hypothetical protein EPO43_09950 [Rugosibacter sp.]